MVSMAIDTVNTVEPRGTSHASGVKLTPWAWPASKKPPVAKTSPSMSPTQLTYTSQSMRLNSRMRPTYTAISDGKDIVREPEGVFEHGSPKWRRAQRAGEGGQASLACVPELARRGDDGTARQDVGLRHQDALADGAVYPSRRGDGNARAQREVRQAQVA